MNNQLPLNVILYYPTKNVATVIPTLHSTVRTSAQVNGVDCDVQNSLT